VRRMFADIDADIYVLVDGDDTYEASCAPRLIEELRRGPYDMVNAVRIANSVRAYRVGHAFGNRLLNGVVRSIFGAGTSDILSGYKVLSRRYVKSFPLLRRVSSSKPNLLSIVLSCAYRPRKSRRRTESVLQALSASSAHFTMGFAFCA
jgi:hypothetical protein